MNIEYEATFWPINEDSIRSKLKAISAVQIKKETLFKRATFFLPENSRFVNGWARVRNEGDKITLSVKSISGNNIEDQKEECIEVSSFESAEQILSLLNCKKKAYQENKREIWMKDEVEICIDKWPFLEPCLEIEADSEEKIKKVVELLELDYSKALFCSIDTLYAKKYNITEDEFIRLPRVTFESNPFLK